MIKAENVQLRPNILKQTV
jgi:hypothetical protein